MEFKKKRGRKGNRGIRIYILKKQTFSIKENVI